MPGKLYIVATPIGNLRDISPRVTQALCDSDFVFAEDTRVTIKLMSHIGVSKRLVSCHDHNEQNRLSALDQAAADNQTVSLVSDAGTPLVSDPGYRMVRHAIALGMDVIPIPGPSAFLLALVGSGLPCEKFVFEGFLPDKPTSARKRLVELSVEPRTIVFYVSPHKLKKTLDMVAESFIDRPACIARELTKFYEEFIRGTVSQLVDKVRDVEVRGECVLVVAGKPAVKSDSVELGHAEVMEAIAEEIRSGKRMADVASEVAQRFNLKKSDVYKLALGQSKDSECDNESM